VGDQEFRKLTREELDAPAGEPLPEQPARSLTNANVAATVHLTAALNVLPDGSVGYSSHPEG
jgi:hypothetical protein